MNLVFVMQYGSWVLTALGLVAVLLLGLGSNYGAVVGVLAQPLWVVYGRLTGQDGFIAWGVAFALIYGIVLICKIRRPKQEKPCEVCAERKKMNDEEIMEMAHAR